MKPIPLVNSDEVAWVDNEHFELAMALGPWRKHGNGYAVRMLYLHHLVLPPKEGFDVDHRNWNPLDNRSTNLRHATRSQNVRNGPLRRNNTSGYRGTYWRKDTKKWWSEIMNNGKKLHLGYFTTKEDAARAYDKKALELSGEFAVLNFP